jgi:hypothetical protein
MQSDEFSDFRKMLLEIGAIGKCVDRTDRYIEGEFQYTLPSKLSISVEEELCVHPMFMRVFSGSRGRQSGPVVLPRGSQISDNDWA